MPVNPNNKSTDSSRQSSAARSEQIHTDPVRNVFQQAMEGLAHLLHKANGSLQHCTPKSCLLPKNSSNGGQLLVSLDNAIETDDFSAVKTFLEAGLEVDAELFDEASRAMKSFILFAGRIQKLYPADRPDIELDQMDRALLDCYQNPEQYKEKFMAAKQVLQNEIGNQSNSVAWRTAVNDGHLSIQKAILLLKPFNKLALNLKDRDKVTDPGVKAVMKEIPYHPQRHQTTVKVNGAARFLGSHAPIQCRHVTMYRLMRQSEASDGKFTLSDKSETYTSTISASIHIPEEVDRHYVNLVRHAPELHLVDVELMGKEIAKQFIKLSATNSTELFLLQAHNHSMSLRLRVKESNGKTHYVLDFYDPNLSNTHVRMASDNLNTFKQLSLSDLIHKQAYKTYFPDGAHLTIMTKVPKNLKQFVQNPQQMFKEPRRLVGYTLVEPNQLIEPEAVYFLMQAGLASEIKHLTPSLMSLNYTERMRALDARSTRGMPGFHMALQDGHTSAVRAFGEILFNLQGRMYPQDLIGLLTAARWDNVPGLYFAMQNGHTETVKEYIQLISALNLPPQTKLMLLNPVNSKGINGQTAAIKNGHPEAAEILDQAIQNLTHGRSFKSKASLTEVYHH